MACRFARLHDFGGHVALRVLDGSTQYLTTAQAHKLADELKLAASQIENANHYPTTELET